MVGAGKTSGAIFNRTQGNKVLNHAEKKHPLLPVENCQSKRLAALAVDVNIHIDGLCPLRQVWNEPVDGKADGFAHPSTFRLAAGSAISDPRIDHHLFLY
jgi:hypothetical protein